MAPKLYEKYISCFLSRVVISSKAVSMNLVSSFKLHSLQTVNSWLGVMEVTSMVNRGLGLMGARQTKL